MASQSSLGDLARTAGLALVTLGLATGIVAAGALLSGSTGWAFDLTGPALIKAAIGGMLLWLAPDRSRTDT